MFTLLFTFKKSLVDDVYNKISSVAMPNNDLQEHDDQATQFQKTPPPVPQYPLRHVVNHFLLHHRHHQSNNNNNRNITLFENVLIEYLSLMIFTIQCHYNTITNQPSIVVNSSITTNAYHHSCMTFSTLHHNHTAYGQHSLSVSKTIIALLSTSSSNPL